MAEGTVSRPQAAFSLMQCSIDPFSEHFLPDIAWTLDGKCLCALTTHGQLFIISASGDVQQHWPGPLKGHDHYGGSLPVSFCPLPNSKVCVLCSDATVHLLDIASSTCKPFSRIKCSFKVGRTVSFCPKTNVMLLVGDGAPPSSPSGPGDDTQSPKQPPVPPLATIHPLLSLWGLENLNRPKLMFTSKRSAVQPPADVPIPLSDSHAWRSCISPDGSFAAVWEPVGGWHLLSTSGGSHSQLSEVMLPPPQLSSSGGELERAIGGPRPVTSIAWHDADSILAVWSDGQVCRVCLDAGSEGIAEVSTTGVVVAPGAVVAKAVGGQEASEGPLGDLPDDPAPLVVVEPEWEDGAAVAQGENYFGTEEEMGDRKGNPIPDKFGATKRVIGWRVAHLVSSPPTSAIANLFSSGAPPTSDTVSRALGLAQAAGVSPASVWQQMWDASAKLEVDVARLVESTSGHPDGAAFLWQEACGVTAASTVAARALLVAALAAQSGEELNAVYACMQSGADVSTLDESTLSACEARMALLHRLDSVDTYCAIHGAAVEVAGLRDMITAGVPAAAASFAAAGNVSALATVLSRHACSIGASQLDVLYHLPDALGARQYLPVLQQIAFWNGTIARERELDYLEGGEPAALLAGQIIAREVTEVTDPFLAAAAAAADPDARSDGVTIEAIDEWVVERALVVDEATGLLPLSTTLLKGWLRMGREAVVPALAGLHMMQTLFRHSHMLEEGTAADIANLSGRDFVASTAPAQVQYVLRCVFPHETITDVEEGARVLTEVVAPAFSALAMRDQALESLLQLEFPDNATWVVSLVQAELQADCVLFGTFGALSAAVLRLVNNYIPEKSSQTPPLWGSLLHLLDSVAVGARARCSAPLPEPAGTPTRSPSAMSDTQRDRWVEKLEQAAGRVRGARILSKHGMHLPACALSAADRRGACGLLRSMLTAAAAAGAASDDPGAAFGRIWIDCRDLHSYIFEGKNLSLAYLLREFVRAALLAQQWDVADRYIKGTPHVKLSKSGTALTLGSAARDMFAAAKSISASDAALAACMRTLSLRATSYRDLQTSLDLVNALRVACAEIGVQVDKKTWQSAVFAGIFSTPTATSSCTSLASPIHSESNLQHETMDVARVPEMKKQLLDSALAAAAPAPAAHYESLCELVGLLYGSKEASLGVQSSTKSAALLAVAESLAARPGGERSATEIALQLCAEGYQAAWRLASQLGCGGAGGVAGASAGSTSGRAGGAAAGAVAESAGGAGGDTRQELTAFALAQCDEGALPQMLAAAEAQLMQDTEPCGVAVPYTDTPDGSKRAPGGGGQSLSGGQVLQLAGGCAAVDGVLADVQRLLQGGMRQGQPPAIEAALRGAAVRCVGLADVAAGDSSAHMCGLATAATACMLELARLAGTGSLEPLLHGHPLPQQPRQRTQLLQCAVRAAALQVVHACGAPITQEALHQPLHALAASARRAQHSTQLPSTNASAAALEKLQGQLEAHLRDLELRAALGASHTHSQSSAPNATPRGGGPTAAAAAASLLPRGAAQVENGAADAGSHNSTAAAAAAAAAGAPASGATPGGTEGAAAGPAVASSPAQQRDAFLELAGRSGATLASGGDASQDIQKALKLARGFSVDTWWVHWGIVQSALAAYRPAGPADTSLLATLQPHSKQLAAHADAALWLLFAWVLPELERTATAPAQWLCFASIAAEVAAALPQANALQHNHQHQHQPLLLQLQLQQLSECCNAVASINSSLQSAIAPMVREASCSIMQPFWRSSPEVPEILSESVSGADALPSPPQSLSALSALYELLDVSCTAQLRAALSQWPTTEPESNGNGNAKPARPQGVCGIDSESADAIALVKLLSGASAADRNPAEVTAMACDSLSALSGSSAVAVATLCSGAEDSNSQCPLPEVATGGAVTPLALHPSAAHALLHSHPALAEPSADQLPASVAAMRALVATWHAASALLAQAPDAAPDPSMHGADSAGADSAAWLLEDLDAIGAHALSFAESALQTAQESTAADGAQVLAHHAVSRGVPISVLSQLMPSVFAAVAGMGTTADAATITPAVDAVILGACMQRADEVVAAVAREADAGERVSTGGSETEGVAMLRSLAGVLDGAAAGGLGSCRQARAALLQKLEAMEQQLGGAAMSSHVMRCAVGLRAELLSSERWGEGAPGASGGKRSLLLARGRAALGGLWRSEEPLRAADVADAGAIEARIVDLVGRGASAEQLQALFGLLRHVLQFGAALGAPPGMFVAAGVISKALVSASTAAGAPALPEALNVLLCCPQGDAGERAGQVEAVSSQLNAAGRPWAACAVALVAGAEEQHRTALGRLLGGAAAAAAGASSGDSELLEHAAELSDPGLLGAVLWGLARAGGETARAALLGAVCVRALRPALQGLPAIGVTGAVYECALPRVVACMCVQGGGAGVLVAGDIVAEYTSFHAQLRRPEGLCANLAQYMHASVERAKVQAQRRAGLEDFTSEVLGYGVDAELVGMLQAGHREVQAQLDAKF